MLRRLLVVLALLSCASAGAQTRRTEGVIFLRTSAPALVDDLRVGDWWIDTDAVPVTAYILTDLTPTWTATGGGGGAPTTATYVTNTPDAGLSAEQALSLLGTGLMKNTTTTGVVSIYAGAACTNQVIEDLSASGAPTCTTITSAYTSGTFNPTAHDLLGVAHSDTLAAFPVLGDMIYSNATPKWARVAGNTTANKQFLSQTGDGTFSAAPSWAFVDLAVGGGTTGVLPMSGGGTGTTGAGTDDRVIVSDNTNTSTWRLLTVCTGAGKALTYDTATNTFGCNTISGGSTPTGTGFRHVVAGVEDAAAKLVDTADINADQVTFAKTQNVAADTILGRAVGTGSGDIIEMSVTSPLSTAGGIVGLGTVPINLGGTGQNTAILAFNALNPMTTRGDIITRDGTNAIRLALGTASQQIRVNAGATALEYFTPSAGAANAASTTVAVTSVGMYFPVTISGPSAAWVTTSMSVICRPYGGGATTVTAETLAVSGLHATVANIVAGTSFDVMVNNPYGLEGTVDIRCIGV